MMAKFDAHGFWDAELKGRKESLDRLAKHITYFKPADVDEVGKLIIDLLDGVESDRAVVDAYFDNLTGGEHE